jgi:D-alanyl-D-alanine dipeptidase
MASIEKRDSVGGGLPPPLPRLRAPVDWRGVPIEPVDEPLVAVADIAAPVRDDPQYHVMGLPGAQPRSMVREGVADRLARVATSLPDGVTLIVWDGWRAFETQRALYDDWMAQLRAAHPDWDAATLARETARFVSVPSVDPACPAPHVTGGAVDLTLGDGEGLPLDLGTQFDAFVPEAGAVALEGVPGTARELRRRLFWAMADAGFTAYVEEWWHFDFGDQFWGAVTGQPARYGPTDPRPIAATG